MFQSAFARVLPVLSFPLERCTEQDVADPATWSFVTTSPFRPRPISSLPAPTRPEYYPLSPRESPAARGRHPTHSCGATRRKGPGSGPFGVSEVGVPKTSRVRRSADRGLAVLAALVACAAIGWTAGSPRGVDGLDATVAGWFGGGRYWPLFVLESVAAVAFVVLLAFGAYRLGRRDRRHVTSALFAALAACAIAAIFVAGWAAARGGGVRVGPTAARPGTVIVDAAFVASAIASEVVRRGPQRVLCGASLLVLLFAGLADEATKLFPLLLAIAAGSLAGYGVRLMVGASTIRPDTDELGDWIRARGVPVRGPLTAGMGGPDALEGKLQDGSCLDVRLADRDTRLTGLLRRSWSLVRLRTPATGRVALTSRSRLHELALSCLLAEKARVRAPVVLLIEPMEDRTLVLVTQRPNGPKPAHAVPAESATALFAALRALHEAGLAHRALKVENLVVEGADVGFASLDHAAPAATELSRRLDVAQLLTTIGRLSGAPVAVAAMRSGYRTVDDAEIASVLQPLALAPWGWAAMRASTGCLAELRSELVGPGAVVPAVPLERFKWRTVLMVAAMVLAAYAVAGELSTVDLLGALDRMHLGWFGIALVGSLVTYIASAVNLEAFVPRRLSLQRSFLVQLAASFVGVAMPSTLGYVAINARYLSRERIDQPTVAAAITLSQLSNIATTVATVVLLAIITGTGIGEVRLVPGTDLLIGAATAAAVVTVLVLVPQTRVRLARLVLPHLRDLLPKLVEAISHPWRLLMSVAASTFLNLGYVLAFYAALAAVGAHPPLVATAIVYLLGSFVGSAAPTPGGLGGVEAALAAGLATIGVPAGEAIPAVVVFRFATFWLPIPVGWVTYAAMQHSGSL